MALQVVQVLAEEHWAQLATTQLVQEDYAGAVWVPAVETGKKPLSHWVHMVAEVHVLQPFEHATQLPVEVSIW